MKRVNDLLGFISYNWKLEKPLNKPQVYAIETTNLCNLDCIMCPRRDMKRKIGTMSLVNFRTIIDKISKYNSNIILNLFGEPLLDKTIYEKIDYCYEKGINTFFSTNATFLDETNAKKLLKTHLTTICLCMDGFTKETYEKIRFKSNFETTKNNIINFMELRKLEETIPEVILQIIKMKETENEINDFLKYWQQFNFTKIYVKDFCIWGDQVEGIKELSRQDQRFLKTDKVRPACYYPWHSVVIYWDGTIAPCCRDYNGKYILGNIFEDDLENIWNGDKFIELRRQHNKLNFNNPLCIKCFDMPDVCQSWYLFNKKNISKILNKTVLS